MTELCLPVTSYFTSLHVETIAPALSCPIPSSPPRPRRLLFARSFTNTQLILLNTLEPSKQAEEPEA